MTAVQMNAILNYKVLMEGTGEDITGCYIGDLLSWVMSRAEEGDIWLTVMGNVNAVAVAVLVGIPCIVLCENAPLDEDAKEKALQNGIAILQTEDNAYEAACKIQAILS